MSDPWLPLPLLAPILIALAFLAGSVPFSLLIGKFNGVDIRSVGSGNVGATNLGRALGRKFFFFGLFADMLKGVVPVVVAGFALGIIAHWEAPLDRTWIWLACVVASVLGHVFSPWIGFKGGKGVATGFGALLGVFPMLTLAGGGTLAAFLICFAIWRRISLGSIVGAMSVCAWVLLLAFRSDGWRVGGLLRGSSGIYFWVTLGIGLLVVCTHRANIKRLLAGTEPEYRPGKGQVSASQATAPAAK
jgi:glycerol-3-phosphate acyltransferase PlsY